MAERETPRVDESDGAVINRSVEWSGSDAWWIPSAFMVAAGVGIGIGIGGLMYLTSPAAGDGSSVRPSSGSRRYLPDEPELIHRVLRHPESRA